MKQLDVPNPEERGEEGPLHHVIAARHQQGQLDEAQVPHRRRVGFCAVPSRSGPRQHAKHKQQGQVYSKHPEGRRAELRKQQTGRHGVEMVWYRLFAVGVTAGVYQFLRAAPAASAATHRRLGGAIAATR